MKFVKAVQTVRPASNEFLNLVDGAKVHECITHIDNRGSLTEAFNTSWDFSSEPIVHVYRVSIAAQGIKAWQYHKTYSDRSFFGWGKFRIVLYDMRPKSPTYKQITTIYAGIEKPRLILIPPLVVHGVQNLSETETSFINMPTKIYSYDDPDKYRIPWDSKDIPYKW